MQGEAGRTFALEKLWKAREHQPWLLSADRTVGGPYENYVTPEQTIPTTAMHVPWDSCITMRTSFSFRYEDKYKPTRQIVNILLEVVVKRREFSIERCPAARWQAARRRD